MADKVTVPNFSQYNFEIGDTVEVVTKQNGMNAALQQFGNSLNQTVDSITEDAEAVEQARQELNADDLVHRPGSGLPNEAGTAAAAEVEDFDAAGTSVAVMQAHTSEDDPHPQYAQLEEPNDFSHMPTVQGVPVVESGSNSDGEWTRWADGTQVCAGSVNAGERTANGSGTYASPYRTSSIGWTYPAAFVNSSARVSLGCRAGIEDALARFCYASFRSLSNSGVSSLQAVSTTGSDITTDIFIHIVANGRWK